MSSTTTRVSLYKPAGGEDINVTTDLNNNYDKLDTNLNFRVVANAAARNAITPFWAGLNVRETDTGKLYVSNGSAPISGSWKAIPVQDSSFDADLDIAAGKQVNIGAANTTASFAAANTATGDDFLSSRISTDTQSRYLVDTDGKTWWGPGGASTQDTNLYRASSNTLVTDDSFSVGVDLTVTGNTNISGDLSVAGIGQVQYVDKPTAQALTVSNTTAQNVTNMVLPVVANGIYTFRLLVWVTSAANAAGDVKFNFTLPTGAVMDWMGNGPDIGLASAAVQAGNWAGVQNSNGGTALAFGVSTTSLGIELYGRVVVSSTAGNMQFQASQNASSASATTIGARSWFTLQRVA